MRLERSKFNDTRIWVLKTSRAIFVATSLFELLLMALFKKYRYNPVCKYRRISEIIDLKVTIMGLQSLMNYNDDMLTSFKDIYDFLDKEQDRWI